MKVVSDLHLHSRYSRAVSPQMNLGVMAEVAKKKGIDLLTASDWTYPVWFETITNSLTETAEGIYTLSADKTDTPTRFLLSTEIASIYKQGDKLRRIHNLVFVPSLDIAKKVTQALLARGANLSADGRPLIGLSSRNLLELILEIDERCMLIPCHIWTPHFGIYGSASGYDFLEEAFSDMVQYVYGIETGISSDPEMNWQIAELRTRSILSFSDAHSAPKMGREATVFELEALTYKNVRQAIMRPSLGIGDKRITGDRGDNSRQKSEMSVPFVPPEPSASHVLYTIEFYPEEGKYHYSGHRNCNVSYGPQDILARGTTCPVCGGKMTEGVMLRVQQLAEKDYKPQVKKELDSKGVLWITDKEGLHPPFVKLVPLLEIVAESIGMRVQSKKVQTTYETLLPQFPSELAILMEAPIHDISKVAGENIARSISRMRRGELTIIPGYDGEYGIVSIKKDEKDDPQLTLL